MLSQKYRLVRLIGAGGMGAVYEAFNEWTERPVAVKLLLGEVSADSLARFFREARVNSKLNHPHIVTVYDLGVAEDGSYFIVQELLRGMSLESRLQRGRLSLREVFETLLPIIDALAIAHDAGVLHRDLKPANIFLKTGPNNETVPVLIDFGLSKSDRDFSGTLTQDAVGTPGYMAPEQALNEPNIGPEADVWAMGAVLYRALSGRPLFDGTIIAVLYKSTNSDPTPLWEVAPELPATLTAVVHQALDRDRGRRTRTMRALIEAILAVPELATQPWMNALSERFSAVRLRDVTLPVNEIVDDEDFISEDHVASLVAGSTFYNTRPTELDQPAASPLAGPTEVDQPAAPPLAGPTTVDLPAAPPLPTRVAPHRLPFVRIVVGLCLVGLLAIALLLWVKRGEEPADSSASEASLSELLPGVCVDWATRLITEQDPNGGFSGIPYRPAGGWATAQAFTALENAKAVCGVPDEAVFERGAAALDVFETESGWVDVGAGDAMTGAAWVVLASVRAVERGEKGAAERLERATRAILRAQHADGALTDLMLPEGNVFQAALTVYALNKAATASRDPLLDTARKRGLDWLRATLDAQLDRPSDWAQSPGVLALSLLALEGAQEWLPADGPLAERVLARLAALCQLEGKTCQRTLNNNDRVVIFAKTAEYPGAIIVLWAPWTLLAATVVERSAMPLSDEARTNVRALRAALETLTLSELNALGQEQGFVLTEWLYVISELQRFD